MAESRRVVGVVGNVRSAGIPLDPEPIVYIRHSQRAFGTMSIVLRTSVPPQSIVERVKDQIWSVDRTVPIYQIETMRERLEMTDSASRTTMELVGAFAGVAIVLVVTGIVGVLAYIVSERTRARDSRRPGSGPPRAARPGPAAGLPAGHVGLLPGLLLATGLGGLLRSQLYGVSPMDFRIHAAVSVVILATVGVACLAPGLRATRIDPATALKQD